MSESPELLAALAELAKHRQAARNFEERVLDEINLSAKRGHYTSEVTTGLQLALKWFRSTFHGLPLNGA